MFRTFVLAATLATVPVLSPCALLGQDAPPPPAGGAHHQSLPKPVNLKVLPQDTTPDQLMKIMHGYSQALGVHCTFCHEVNQATKHPDFASDAKPEKNTARTMIAMTGEINQKYMSQIHDPDAAPDQRTVSCGTCHQGHNMPVSFKPPPEHHDMDHHDTPPKP